MSVIDDLVFDRTQTDIDNKTDKAYIDYNDLNRIESAVQFVSNLLNAYNYKHLTENKTDWSIRDIRFQTECDRIRRNYLVLKNVYYFKNDTPDVPDNINWSSIQQANAIEKILYDIDYLLDRMIASFRPCGTFACAGMEGLI